MKVLLIVTYIYRGTVSVDQYPMQTPSECAGYAKQIFQNVKAGRVKTQCKIIHPQRTVAPVLK